MAYKIKEVADIAGVSIRTLHHYDQIGIFKPEAVSSSGYRLYSSGDLEKLQHILFFRELDFTLQEIKEILQRPDFDRKNILKLHKELLVEKKKRLEKIIKSVEITIASIEGGKEMKKEEMFEGFDMAEIEKHKEKYAEETKQKYGNSDAYKESSRRTAKYTKEDWAGITAKGDEIYKRLADLMDRAPEDSDVQQAIAEKRQHITDSFYNCTPEIFRGLGELYVSDERFTANIDRYRQGLSEFLRKAINVYCNNLE